MSHPATIHEPMTVPTARALLSRLGNHVNHPEAASADLHAMLRKIQYAFDRGDFLDAAEWLIRLNAETISGPPDDLEDSPFWFRDRSTDDDLQLLAEAFGELTMGIEKPYWEIILPTIRRTS